MVYFAAQGSFQQSLHVVITHLVFVEATSQNKLDVFGVFPSSMHIQEGVCSSSNKRLTEKNETPSLTESSVLANSSPETHYAFLAAAGPFWFVPTGTVIYGLCGKRRLLWRRTLIDSVVKLTPRWGGAQTHHFNNWEKKANSATHVMLNI